jgi:hypothetical protein
VARDDQSVRGPEPTRVRGFVLFASLAFLFLRYCYKYVNPPFYTVEAEMEMLDNNQLGG